VGQTTGNVADITKNWVLVKHTMMGSQKENMVANE
jgi:hypothetical protein